MRSCALLLLALPAALIAQTPQYRSPATGVTYLSQRDTGSLTRLTMLVTAEPSDVDHYVELGSAQSALRQFREAITTYTRGLGYRPNDAALLGYRGHRYINVREFDSAQADLERGNRADSANYDVWYHLGVLRFVQGWFDAAGDAFLHAQRSAPNDNELAGSTDWLWMSMSRAHRPDDAAAALSRLKADLHVTTATAYAKRLDLYRGRIQPDAMIGPADTSGIQVATLSYGIGNWYLVKGDTTAARRWFQRAVQTDGWPAFGFIVSEVELRRLTAPR